MNERRARIATVTAALLLPRLAPAHARLLLDASSSEKRKEEAEPAGEGEKQPQQQQHWLRMVFVKACGDFNRHPFGTLRPEEQPQPPRAAAAEPDPINTGGELFGLLKETVKRQRKSSSRRKKLAAGGVGGIGGGNDAAPWELELEECGRVLEAAARALLLV